LCTYKFFITLRTLTDISPLFCGFNNPITINRKDDLNLYIPLNSFLAGFAPARRLHRTVSNRLTAIHPFTNTVAAVLSRSIVVLVFVFLFGLSLSTRFHFLLFVLILIFVTAGFTAAPPGIRRDFVV
jgi:hypothetical protein